MDLVHVLKCGTSPYNHIITVMYLLKKGGRQAGKKSPASQDTFKHTGRQGAEEAGFLYKRDDCQARNAGTEPGVFYVVEEG